MKKHIDLWEYAGHILEQVGTAALVTTKAEGQVNTMTIGWGTLGVEWKKPLFTVFVRPAVTPRACWIKTESLPLMYR